MPQQPATLTLPGLDEQHYLCLSDFHYHGNGAYSCLLQVRSSGFACDKIFSFDNDEYFLTKLKEVLTHKQGDAELMALQSDNYLKIQATGADDLLISGLIQEAQPLSHVLEFAFISQYHLLERFVSDLSGLVKANI
jgi:hypothetical protein